MKRKLFHRHIDDRIHMHFHDHPTDTQHHSAHTYEVSLGDTTPLISSDTARSTFGSQAELPSSTLAWCCFLLPACGWCCCLSLPCGWCYFHLLVEPHPSPFGGGSFLPSFGWRCFLRHLVLGCAEIPVGATFWMGNVIGNWIPSLPKRRGSGSLMHGCWVRITGRYPGFIKKPCANDTLGIVEVVQGITRNGGRAQSMLSLLNFDRADCTQSLFLRAPL